MTARYQHVTDPIRRDVADRIGGLFWAKREEADGANAGPAAPTAAPSGRSLVRPPRGHTVAGKQGVGGGTWTMEGREGLSHG
jgi:hypothetical protein